MERERCIGCQACVDVCPKRCITFDYDAWGEGKATIDFSKCIDCGLCAKICPSRKIKFNDEQLEVYAVLSKENRRKGSSGGFFYEIAKEFVRNGGIVYGAAFNKELKLKHIAVDNIPDIIPLCKSKYLHSDMTGIYKDIGSKLLQGQKVMFVGTPCQTSAVKNLYKEKYAGNLILIDFLCHGTGTQKIFDACISEEEKIKNGKIKEFYFRSKSRRAEHSFTYILEQKGKNKEISGYSFEFPYYHSYLQYTIFNDYCYECKYATETRVGDITLGDFWGINKYNNKLKAEKGVSMICVNSLDGKTVFDTVKDKCNIWQYPLSNASQNNESFIKPVKYPQRKSALRSLMETKGEREVVQEMRCAHIKKNIIYSKCPKFVLRIYHFLRGRK